MITSLAKCLAYCNFAIVFPFVVDLSDYNYLSCKVLTIETTRFAFKPSFMTIVCPTLFANCVCSNILGGLGSIYSNIRTCAANDQGLFQKVLFRDPFLDFCLCAASLAPGLSFLASRLVRPSPESDMRKKLLVSAMPEIYLDLNRL